MTQLKNNRMKKYILLLSTSLCLGVVLSVHAANVSLPDIPVEQTPYTNTTNAGGIINTSADNAVSGTNIQYTTPGVQYPTVNTPTNTSKLSISGLVAWFVELINYIIKFILTLALIAFLWGIFRLVFVDATNEAERAKAKKFILWGIVALFVMTSVWGLVNVLHSSVFGGSTLIIPQLK